MKSLKIAKNNIQGIIKPAVIFYGIFISVIIIMIISNLMAPGTVGMSGVEVSTVIFLFICGLNSFKVNFYFAKANNISRNTFMKGILISALPVVFVTSIIDIIINRISNIFIVNPTFYDMSYGGFLYNCFGKNFTWNNMNSIGILFNAVLLQFTICLAAYLLGLVINMIYYRCNKIMKTVVSIVPIAFVILINTLAYNFPAIANGITKFVNFIFGFEPENVYAAVTTFIVISAALALGSFLLIKKAVIKER